MPNPSIGHKDYTNDCSLNTLRGPSEELLQPLKSV